MEPMSLYDYTALDLNPLVKISDLGGGEIQLPIYLPTYVAALLISNTPTAFFEASPPPSITTLAGLRAPEVILKDELSTALDIWSFGCLVFELVTDHTLFNVGSLDGDRHDETENDQHLIQITEIIQPLPEVLFNKWARRTTYYGPSGERIDSQDDLTEESPDIGGSLDNEIDERKGSYHGIDTDTQSEASLASTRRFDPLEKVFKSVKPADIDEEEEKQIVSLIRLALQPDITMRASAAQLLQHVWFRGGADT